MASSTLRLGLIGGTFNPIHFGPLRAAEEITELMSLDEVLFIPAALPPHKDPTPVVEFSHRLKMVQTSIKDHPWFSSSDLEAGRQGPSYTVDSLRYLHQKYGDQLDPFFILGHEAFLEIHSWKEYRTLFDLTNFVVISRPKFNPEQVSRLLKEYISPNFSWDPNQAAFTRPGKRTVFYRGVTRLDISSTDIRTRVAHGATIRYLVPEAVARFISEHKLYS